MQILTYLLAGALVICGRVHSTSNTHHIELQDRQEYHRWLDKDALQRRGSCHICVMGRIHGRNNEWLTSAGILSFSTSIFTPFCNMPCICKAPARYSYRATSIQTVCMQHASTMIQFMWQADLHGVANFIAECLGVYYSTDPDGDQASDQP